MQIPFLLAALLLGVPVSPDSTGEDVLRGMHERYKGRWPTTVTFTQKSTFYEAGNSTRIQTWYEAIEAPGKLRIDIYPFERGNGMIFRNDSLYEFERDSLVRSASQPHALMVLSRDVYFLPVKESVAKLRKLGFDLSRLREDTWQGRSVYVIGAEKGDLKSAQFWIDKENLYFVRLIQPTRPEPSRTREVQFNRYRRLDGGWIETEVVFMADGKREMLEEYSDIRANAELDDKLFDPKRWGRPGWVQL